MNLSGWLKTFRLPFLVLAPVCVFLGYRLAVAELGRVDSFLLWLIMAGALAAHISVNTLNEYLDFRSGLDVMTRRTPFSGGSGALPSGGVSASLVLWTAISGLLVASVIGIYLAFKVSWYLLPPGVAGLLIVIFYTSWINRHPVLCFLAPGIGFGLLMVSGTALVLTGHISITVFLVSLFPTLLVSNLLLLNQLPDIEADKRAGRRHLAILLDRHGVMRVYGITVLLAAVDVVLCVLSGLLHWSSLWALVPLLPGIIVCRGMFIYKEWSDSQSKYLAMNVAMILLAITVLAVSIKPAGQS